MVKRNPIFLIINLFLALTLFAPFFTFAATPAGLTPKSPFYFLDTLSEKIVLFFTFNPERKAEKALEYANERLSEAEASTEEKNSKGVETALIGYKESLSLASAQSKEVKDSVLAENLFNEIASTTSNNEKILVAVFNKVPEEAKQAITQAIEASKKGQEEALKQIAELKQEVAGLKQEIAELKKQQKIEPIPTTQNSQNFFNSLVEQKKSEEKLKTTTVNLSNLNSFIDTLIANHEENITYAKENIESTEFYDNNFFNSRILIPSLIQDETDPGIKKAYEILSKTTDEQIKYNEETRNTLLTNIKSMEDAIVFLKKEKEKNLLSDPVSVERYWAYYDALAKIDIPKNTKILVSNYNDFVSKTNKFQSFVRSAMTLINARADANYRAQMSAINSERESLRANSVNQPTYINYQPVVYPQIQMPKITHCTISGDGGAGYQAYVTCNESSF